ncbi:uncharacterized protein DDB_G0290301-like [Battus philenor]|uniref:uncharacterized protein DDB_G0290301-like n=1 Tax=Battus philenor TaxID=42288 RepID=UPI0035CE8DA7
MYDAVHDAFLLWGEYPETEKHPVPDIHDKQVHISQGYGTEAGSTLTIHEAQGLKCEAVKQQTPSGYKAFRRLCKGKCADLVKVYIGEVFATQCGAEPHSHKIKVVQHGAKDQQEQQEVKEVRVEKKEYRTEKKEERVEYSTEQEHEEVTEYHNEQSQQEITEQHTEQSQEEVRTEQHTEHQQQQQNKETHKEQKVHTEHHDHREHNERKEIHEERKDHHETHTNKHGDEHQVNRGPHHRDNGKKSWDDGENWSDILFKLTGFHGKNLNIYILSTIIA